MNVPGVFSAAPVWYLPNSVPKPGKPSWLVPGRVLTLQIVSLDAGRRLVTYSAFREGCFTTPVR